MADLLMVIDDSNQAEASSLAEVERWHIARTLVVHEGSPTWAARELSISRATLIKQIKSYGLPVSTGSAHLNPTRMP
ncbi:MAG: helix-turn-helix domain-containing protein [Gemmatimonadaceae bacterium]|nr:helix-turn-helix domain-containing protein [Gemmatimonadaceae bacterium]